MTHGINVTNFFVAWEVFMEAISPILNLKTDGYFLPDSLSEVFIKTGHGPTDIIIDCTEFNLQQSSNYDLSAMTFSI